MARRAARPRSISSDCRVSARHDHISSSRPRQRLTMASASPAWRAGPEGCLVGPDGLEQRRPGRPGRPRHRRAAVRPRTPAVEPPSSGRPARRLGSADAGAPSRPPGSARSSAISARRVDAAAARPGSIAARSDPGPAPSRAPWPATRGRPGVEVEAQGRVLVDPEDEGALGETPPPCAARRSSPR